MTCPACGAADSAVTDSRRTPAGVRRRRRCRGCGHRFGTVEALTVAHEPEVANLLMVLRGDGLPDGYADALRETVGILATTARLAANGGTR